MHRLRTGGWTATLTYLLPTSSRKPCEPCGEIMRAEGQTTLSLCGPSSSWQSGWATSVAESGSDVVRYLVLVLKLCVVPAGLLILATGVVQDERLGLMAMSPWMLLMAVMVNQLALTLFAVRMKLILADRKSVV